MKASKLSKTEQASIQFINTVHHRQVHILLAELFYSTCSVNTRTCARIILKHYTAHEHFQNFNSSYKSDDNLAAKYCHSELLPKSESNGTYMYISTYMYIVSYTVIKL